MVEPAGDDSTRLRCLLCTRFYCRETSFIKTSLGRHLNSTKHTLAIAEDTVVPAVPSATPTLVAEPVKPTTLVCSQVSNEDQMESTYRVPEMSFPNLFDDVFIGDEEIITASGETLQFSAGSLYSRHDRTRLLEDLGALDGSHTFALPLPLFSDENSGNGPENLSDSEPPPEEDSFISPMLEVLHAMGQ